MFSEQEKEEIRKLFRNRLFSRNEETSIIKRIMRSKKLSPEKKLVIIIDMYKVYLEDGIISDAKFKAYQDDFEKFIINPTTNERNESIYQECCATAYEDILYYHLVFLIKDIKTLKEQGLDVSKLTNGKQNYLKLIDKLKEDCFGEDFVDFQLFYFDSDFRRDVANKMRWFVKDYEKLQTEDKYELYIN